MIPHLDSYAAFIDLEAALLQKRAAREALVDAAMAARRSAAEDRPIVAAAHSLRHRAASIRPVQWMFRLAQPSGVEQTVGPNVRP